MKHGFTKLRPTKGLLFKVVVLICIAGNSWAEASKEYSSYDVLSYKKTTLEHAAVPHNSKKTGMGNQAILPFAFAQIVFSDGNFDAPSLEYKNCSAFLVSTYTRNAFYKVTSINSP